MSLQLAYVTMGISPYELTGPSSIAHQLVKQLLLRGVEVTLIVGSRGTTELIKKSLGHDCQLLLVPLDSNIFNYLKFVTDYSKIISKVDVVHLNTLYFGRTFYFPIIPYIKKKPTVFSLHGIYWWWTYWLQNPIKANLLYNVFYTIEKTFMSSIVVNSQYMEKIATHYQKFNSSKISVIPNAVDSSLIRQAGSLKLDGTLKLLYVGRVVQSKGIDLVVKALSILGKRFLDNHGIIFYIVGSGDYQPSLQSLISKLSLTEHVKFIGRSAPPEVYKYYNSCDMFLSTPHGTEGFGLTLIEAMTAGKPVIATKRGAIPEIIDDGKNGFLTERDPEQIAEAIRLLSEDAALRKAIGENNLSASKLYSWKNIADSYVHLYKKLISQQR